MLSKAGSEKSCEGDTKEYARYLSTYGLMLLQPWAFQGFRFISTSKTSDSFIIIRLN